MTTPPKSRVLLDSQIFHKLTGLPRADLLTILNKFKLVTTNINVMELNRNPDDAEKKRILEILKSCEQINAKVFGFLDTNNPNPVEDSLGGFATYDSPEGGRVLSYNDADVLKTVGIEKNKTKKGRGSNDAAIALAFMNDPAPCVVDDRKLQKRLKKLGKNVISFSDFLVSAGITPP